MEFEELSRQLCQRSRGKEGNARFANEGTFVFFLRIAFGFHCGRWKARYVSELFHFLKFVVNFLKGAVSICHNFQNTGQPGRINGFDRCFQAFKLSIDVQLGAIELFTPVLAILKFYQPHMGK